MSRMRQLTIPGLRTKAARSLGAARHLFQSGDYDFASGRAYYAMFYMAEAALLDQGHQYSTHAGVHGAFARHLVKEGRISKEHHTAMQAAFDLRVTAEYEAVEEVDAGRAAKVIQDAEQFVASVEAELNRGS